ncbi:MAG: hypothetical protein C5B59_12765 [Bacteroidetes bacterium]|nr:MAG: hypothetical protein C5B59_12765 [Bacteroidota bacterium]
MNPLFEIVRKEIDDSHFYFVDGEYYPGVTSILDEAAPVPWALKQYFINGTPDSIASKSETTLAFGSKMHDAYEKLLNGVSLNLRDDYRSTKEKKHIASMVAWARTFRPEVIQTECTVASKELKYAGTLDLLCKINNELWIIDFKTSAGIYSSYHWQVEAYRKAVKETFGLDVAHCLIVRTGTTHKVGYEAKESEASFADFKRIYDTYLSLHGGKIPDPPSVIAYPDTIAIEEKL